MHAATQEKHIRIGHSNLRRAASGGKPVFALLLASALGTLALAAFGQTESSYSNLTLRDALQLAESSPQARQGQDQVDAAHGLVIQAGLRPNPRLYLQSEDLRPWASNFDFPNATEDYAYLAQLFELGGKRARRTDAANTSVRQAEAERLLLLQQIAGRVAVAYWNAVVSTGIAQLLEKDTRAVDEIVRYNRERVDAGAMRGIDLIRVQIERDRLLLALESARRDATLARIELFHQMGRPFNPRVNLTDTLDSMTPVQPQSLQVVLSTRADVAVAKEAVAAAEVGVRLQHALAVPDLDLLGGYKRNSGSDTIYTSLQIPLPFRNRNQGEVARAQANLQFERDRLQQIEISVAADVNAAQEAYAHQGTIVREILPDMRARARQNVAIMDDAYRAGGVDLLRYLDAERTAFDVEASALRTLADYQQAALRLQLAYGVHP